MIKLFKPHYRPQNYSQQEIAQVLENGKKTGQLLRLIKTVPTKQIMKELGISEPTVFRMLKKAGAKKPKIVTNMRPVDGTIVINLETGIFYSSINRAAVAYGYNKHTLRDWLVGKCTRRNYNHRKTPDYLKFKIV